MNDTEEGDLDDISEINDTILIHPSLCNSCFGYYSVPQCIANCSMGESCEIDFRDMVKATIASLNYWQTWLAKSENLIKKPKHYGKKWLTHCLHKIKSLLFPPLI